MNGCKDKDKLSESQVNRIVKKIYLSKLVKEESEKIIKSFYTYVGDKSPVYPNLNLDGYTKEKINENSKGNPLIIKLFFEEITTGKSTKEEITISYSDADNIKSDVKYYALRQLFNYYFGKLDNNREVTDTLAFLYFIAKNGYISIGHLKRINKEYLSAEISKHILQLKQNKSFPLFRIDNFGIMVPFHDSVSEAIIRLVEDPVTLLAEIPSNEEDIIDEIRTVKDFCEELEYDIDGGIKGKIEDNFTKQYKGSLLKWIDSFIKSKFDKTHKILGYDLYEYLSMFIELITPIKEIVHYKEITESEEEIRNLIINNIKAIFKVPENILYGDIEGNIDKQLYWIGKKFDLFRGSIESLDNYYLKLLSSPETDIRIECWYSIPDLIENAAITVENIKQIRKHFFDIIESFLEKDEHNWKFICFLIRSGILTYDDRNFFLNLLNAQDDGIKLITIFYLTLIRKTSKILDHEVDYKELLYKLIQSSNEYIQMGIWISFSLDEYSRYSFFKIYETGIENKRKNKNNNSNKNSVLNKIERLLDVYDIDTQSDGKRNNNTRRIKKNEKVFS